MLVLRRRDGQWVELTHAASGDVLRVRVQRAGDGQADLVFDDDDRHFAIRREERGAGDGPLRGRAPGRPA